MYPAGPYPTAYHEAMGIWDNVWESKAPIILRSWWDKQVNKVKDLYARYAKATHEEKPDLKRQIDKEYDALKKWVRHSRRDRYYLCKKHLDYLYGIWSEELK